MTQFAPIWNSSGVDFTALRVNATDIASSGTSKLIDLRVNNSGVFSVDKTGSITYGNGLSLNSVLSGYLPLSGGTLTGGLSGTTATFTGALRLPTDNAGIYFSASGNSHGRISSFGTDFYFDLSGAGNTIFRTNNSITTNLTLYGGASPVGAFVGVGLAIGDQSTRIMYEANHILAQRSGTNPQTFRIYNTFTDASNYERAFLRYSSNVFEIGTERAGTSTDRDVRIMRAGSNRISLQNNATQIGGIDGLTGLIVNSDGTSYFASGGNINQYIGGYYMVCRGSLFNDPSNLSGVIGFTAGHVAGANCQVGFRFGGLNQINLQATHAGAFQDLALRKLFFQGNTASFPCLDNSSTTIRARLGDDSGFASFSANNGTFSGHLSATTKSFLIKHPTKEGRKLQYGSLESPYHGIRLTGRDQLINGSCVVELPDYVSALVHDDVNIQLTPIGRNVVWVEEHDLESNTFTVKGDQSGKFYWSFTAVRKDIEPLEVEPWE